MFLALKVRLSWTGCFSQSDLVTWLSFMIFEEQAEERLFISAVQSEQTGSHEKVHQLHIRVYLGYILQPFSLMLNITATVTVIFQ